MMEFAQSDVSLFYYLQKFDEVKISHMSSIDEYLGPAPCVAGFLLTENETEILFWDAYLKVAWTHQSTWSIEAEFDEKVEAWFPIIRFTST